MLYLLIILIIFARVSARTSDREKDAHIDRRSRQKMPWRILPKDCENNQHSFGIVPYMHLYLQTTHTHPIENHFYSINPSKFFNKRAVYECLSITCMWWISQTNICIHVSIRHAYVQRSTVDDIDEHIYDHA